jgi:hypothetical protein
MITFLDAVLVDGWNSQTVTSVTRSGSTVTVTKTAHGFAKHQLVTISGANETDYNGNWRITAATANDFTFTIGTTPASPATGTISCKVTPLGWTKDYTGTNLAAYRMGGVVANSGSYQGYIRVDDTAATGSKFRLYATMSDVNTGTKPLPDATLANGKYITKSSTANATTRPWIIVGNEKGFWLKVYGAHTTPLVVNSAAYTNSNTSGSLYIGALVPIIDGDPNPGITIGWSDGTGGCNWAQGTTGTSTSNWFQMYDYTNTNIVNVGLWRAFAGVPGSSTSANPQWPSISSGKILYSEECILWDFPSSRCNPRGFLPGAACLFNDTYTTANRSWDTILDGTKEYLIVPTANGTTNAATPVRLDGPGLYWDLL